MATLSQMCELPQGWLALAAEKEQKREVRMSKKLEWKVAKRKQHEQLMAYRERVRKRGGVRGESLESSRRRVRLALMADDVPVLESGREMFAICKGQRSHKKVKNSVSRERMGTVGRTIVTKRFDGSRLTCVCKSIVY